MVCDNGFDKWLGQCYFIPNQLQEIMSALQCDFETGKSHKAFWRQQHNDKTTETSPLTFVTSL